MLVKQTLELKNHFFEFSISDVRTFVFNIPGKHNISHKCNKGRKMAGNTCFTINNNKSL